jgi:formylglycine-generating enzyme
MSQLGANRARARAEFGQRVKVGGNLLAAPTLLHVPPGVALPPVAEKPPRSRSQPHPAASTDPLDTSWRWWFARAGGSSVVTRKPGRFLIGWLGAYRRAPRALTLLLAASSLASCGGRIAPDESHGIGGIGGVSGGIGGASGSGGAGTLLGGTTSTSSTRPATGGTTIQGGSSAQSGGGKATGGASAQSGGGKATGGASVRGGTTSTGGSRPTGGSATGGLGTGGTRLTGGAPPTGGTMNTGGSVSTGGSTTGGASATGGTPGAGTAGTSARGGNAGSAGTPAAGTTSSAGATQTAGNAGTSASGGAAGMAGTAGATTTTPPSCVGLGPICQGESCCTTLQVPGGTFPMGRSVDSSASDYYPSGYPEELPEHSATVADFALDKYEVTVGRFRGFVNNYDAWHGAALNPQLGAGTNPTVDPSDRNATGWGMSWTPSSSDLPADSAALVFDLKCLSSYQTWTDSAGANESYPINCVRWHVAFAFCIWDGAWLPTDAEWEYAAAGGEQNLLYPWGHAAPDSDRANYLATSGTGTPFVTVGSKNATGGTGAFGHADLAGSIWEWVFDWYSSSYYGTATAPVTCNNCVNTTATSPSLRSIRGGGFGNSNTETLRAAEHIGWGSTSRNFDTGIRCARAVP